MKYDATTPYIAKLDALPDGAVIALADYDAKTQEITVRGKGAPRAVIGGEIIIPEQAAIRDTSRYVTDGTVVVVGTVKVDAVKPEPKTEQAARVAQSGRSNAVRVTRKGGRKCDLCGGNLSPNPKAKHTCPTPDVIAPDDSTRPTSGENVHADYEALRALILSADLTPSHRWALVRLLAQ